MLQVQRPLAGLWDAQYRQNDIGAIFKLVCVGCLGLGPAAGAAGALGYQSALSSHMAVVPRPRPSSIENSSTCVHAKEQKSRPKRVLSVCAQFPL